MASSDNVPQPLKGFFADLPPESVKAKKYLFSRRVLELFLGLFGGRNGENSSEYDLWLECRLENCPHLIMSEFAFVQETKEIVIYEAPLFHF